MGGGGWGVAGCHSLIEGWREKYASLVCLPIYSENTKPHGHTIMGYIVPEKEKLSLRTEAWLGVVGPISRVTGGQLCDMENGCV